MSSDEIDDSIELHLIDTKTLVEEAKRQRKARELINNSKKIKRELAAGKTPIAAAHPEDEEALPAGFEPEKQLPETGIAPIVRKHVEKILKEKKELASGVSPFGKTGIPTGIFGPTGANTPKGFFDSEQQSRKSAIGGARTENAFTEMQQKQKELEQKIKDFEDKIKDAEKEDQEFMKKIMGVSSLTQLTLNPAGYGAATRSIAFAKLGAYGIIGSMVVAAGTEIINEVEKEFGPGGAYDTRLKVPPQATTLNNIDVQNSWKNGTRYISSDLRIQQKSPMDSNTQKITFETVRYAMDNLGRTL